MLRDYIPEITDFTDAIRINPEYADFARHHGTVIFPV